MKNESYCQPGESRQRGRTVNDCSHVYSDGTGVHGLFENKQEIYGGMNLVAVTAFYCDVKVLMVQVMTTHIHLIVSGSAASRVRFAKDLKIKLGKILAKKNPGTGARLSVSSDPISEERELMSKIMYVYRNAITAGYKLVPGNVREVGNGKGERGGENCRGQKNLVGASDLFAFMPQPGHAA